MVIFGPALDATGSWGLGVVEAQDENALRARCGRPVVASGSSTIEIGRLLSGFVRPDNRPPDAVSTDDPVLV
jgi:hypothetical protein